ncbi:Glycosyltransferase involved in cell wall bisynthesis [Chryseobacterium wanjuense]|uniref:Glycosyltransferase involved in cell wall bisynthesis n=1 Tax=Chryseobacterium wanjuense TaxID=356305 RepID=A0A1I0N051_9FLAO|nr:glycosyltransferase family 4 protein [Chryseobacterium wanjuense]SEV94402.1 Glycosyltransferase involved in cell wall bisynthesis [Chryseobacterium wanjuense]
MIKIFQISSEVNSGSVGRIAEHIGEKIIDNGWESYIAYGRDHNPSKSNVIPIGNKISLISHGLKTRLTDRHGFGSVAATKKLIKTIKEINPDLIQLQHLHGYFVNIEILFNFLSEFKKPIVWTFHDCWSFTGHCAYYEFVDCHKWKTECFKCPQTHDYPQSYIDQSTRNFRDKKRIFNSVENLTIVPVSNWIGDQVKESFLKNFRVHTIHNGIDIEKFAPQNAESIKEKYNLKNKFIILGVASPWSERKGLKYFVELSKNISDDYQIILIGLNDEQIKKLPSNIIGVKRTENIKELAEFYSVADVFVNPTLEDTFPTTNLEAQSCGTPVITFKTGGAPEAIDENTGIVVEKGNVQGLLDAIQEIKKNGKQFYTKECRKRAELKFNKNDRFQEYLDLYCDILKLN